MFSFEWLLQVLRIKRYKHSEYFAGNEWQGETFEELMAQEAEINAKLDKLHLERPKVSEAGFASDTERDLYVSYIKEISKLVKQALAIQARRQALWSRTAKDFDDLMRLFQHNP